MMILRELADRLHARRLAAAPPGTAIAREETEYLIHLIAVAAFGDALLGAQLRRSAGTTEGAGADRAFRDWLTGLIRGRDER